MTVPLDDVDRRAFPRRDFYLPVQVFRGHDLVATSYTQNVSIDGAFVSAGSAGDAFAELEAGDAVYLLFGADTSAASSYRRMRALVVYTSRAGIGLGYFGAHPFWLNEFLSRSAVTTRAERARSRAKDAKKDRGVGPYGVQLPGDGKGAARRVRTQRPL